LIFLGSVFYVAATHKSVNQSMRSLLSASSSTRISVKLSERELGTQITEWRAEYDHPSLVTKSRRLETSIKKKTKDFDNWEHYLQEPAFQQPWLQNMHNKEQLRMSPIFGREKASRFSGEYMKNKSSVDRFNRSVQNVEQHYYNREEAIIKNY